MSTRLATPTFVIPVQAGTQYAAAFWVYLRRLRLPGSRFRGNDD
jgi:hypothetical protein